MNELTDKSKDIEAVLDKYSEKLDIEQLTVLPMLGYGMSIERIAKHTNISPQKIRMWRQTSSDFRAALDEFRVAKQDYHVFMLNQAGVLAWDKVFDYLEMDTAEESDKKIQADIAKFVIGQMGLKTSKQEIQHKIEPQLHVSEDSAGLIARKLKELQDGSIDTVDSDYRIVVDDEKTNTAGMATARALDSFQDKEPDAEFAAIASKPEIYVRHPNSTYGELTYNDRTKKWLCHMCGAWSADLVVHIRTEHKLSPARYRAMYGLPEDTKFFVEQPREATDEEIESFNQGLNES